MVGIVTNVEEYVENSVDLDLPEMKTLFPCKPVDRENEYPIGTIQYTFTRKLYVFRKLFLAEQQEAYTEVRKKLLEALQGRDGDTIQRARENLRHVNRLTPIFAQFITELLWHYVKTELEVDNPNIDIREGWIVVVADQPPFEMEEVLVACSET